MVELVLLPGLDGTGHLFRPLVARLSGVETKVVSYPNDKALSLDEHARRVIRQLPADKAVLLAESFSARLPSRRARCDGVPRPLRALRARAHRRSALLASGQIARVRAMHF